LIILFFFFFTLSSVQFKVLAVPFSRGYTYPNFTIFDGFGIENPTNYVLNSEYELGHGSTADNWNTWGSASGSAGRTQDIVFSGSFSAYVNNTGRGANKYLYLNSDIFSVEASIRYEFKAWLYTKSASYGDIGVRLYYLNSSDDQIGYEKIYSVKDLPITPNQTWRQLYHVITPPATTVRMYISFQSRNQSLFYFDEVVFAKYSALILKEGGYANPIPIQEKSLPKDVTVSAKLIVNDTLITADVYSWTLIKFKKYHSEFCIL